MPLVGEYEPSPSERSRNQVDTYETSGGTDGLTLGDTGLPVIVVTSLGAKSGKLRKTPLMRVEHDGVYAAVGSMGGAPKNPVWVYNLRAEPATVLQDGPSRFELVAREISGGERDLWWERCVAAFPPYAEYQTRTDRLIPVFLLEPAPSA
jgi:deazaflavin-dependent oxidoreductase (nitroreductase family)